MFSQFNLTCFDMCKKIRPNYMANDSTTLSRPNSTIYGNKYATKFKPQSDIMSSTSTTYHITKAPKFKLPHKRHNLTTKQ